MSCALCVACVYSAVNTTKSSLMKDLMFTTGSSVLYSSAVSTVARSANIVDLQLLPNHVIVHVLFAYSLYNNNNNTFYSHCASRSVLVDTVSQELKDFVGAKFYCLHALAC